MNGSRAGSCHEEHVTGASEFHSDGRLCGEWLAEQENARPAQYSLSMEMVIRDQLDHWGMFDRGQLLRLQKSLTPPRFRIESE